MRKFGILIFSLLITLGILKCFGVSSLIVHTKEKAKIHWLTEQYVNKIQTYDYRTITKISIIGYLRPEYRELVEKHFPTNVSHFQDKREVQQVKSVKIKSTRISGDDAYVTYIVQVQGTRAGITFREVVRGDLTLRRIEGKWLIDLDDLEEQNDY